MRSSFASTDSPRKARPHRALRARDLPTHAKAGQPAWRSTSSVASQKSSASGLDVHGPRECLLGLTLLLCQREEKGVESFTVQNLVEAPPIGELGGQLTHAADAAGAVAAASWT